MHSTYEINKTYMYNYSCIDNELDRIQVQTSM